MGIQKRPTQTPSRQSAPCLSHSQDLSDDDVELVTEAEREEAGDRQDDDVEFVVSEAEREEADVRQEVRRVRYPTPRLPPQIPRSLSPGTHRESLSVSPTAA